MISDLSTTPQGGLFIYEVRGDDDLLTDVEIGGVGLNDASSGLLTKLWVATYDGSNVYLSSHDVQPIPIISVVGITRLALSFDNNMQPFLAFEDGFGSHFYWFDSVTHKFVTTDLPEGSVDVCATADDNRAMEQSSRDIILAYRRSGRLYGRQQRDRYGVEYDLGSLNVTRLVTIGMNDKLRLQYKSAGLPIGV